MIKTYILDTNVLLHNPGALFAFEDNQIVIPMAVIEEIDNQKRRQDEIGRNARVVSQELDKLQGKLVRILPDGGIPKDNPFVGREGVRPEIWSTSLKVRRLKPAPGQRCHWRTSPAC